MQLDTVCPNPLALPDGGTPELVQSKEFNKVMKGTLAGTRLICRLGSQIQSVFGLGCHIHLCDYVASEPFGFDYRIHIKRDINLGDGRTTPSEMTYFIFDTEEHPAGHVCVSGPLGSFDPKGKKKAKLLAKTLKELAGLFFQGVFERWGYEIDCDYVTWAGEDCDDVWARIAL